MGNLRQISQTNAFTLIEILIVTSIIMILAVAGIPSISQFGKRADFEDHRFEIEALINQVGIKSKNPDKGYDRYQVVVDPGSKYVRLERVKGMQIETVRQIDLGSNQTASYTYYPGVYCKTTGSECGYYVPNTGALTPMAPNYLGSFLTLTDNSTNPILSRVIWVRMDPFSAQAR